MNRQTRRHPVGPHIPIPYASKKRVKDMYSPKKCKESYKGNRYNRKLL